LYTINNAFLSKKIYEIKKTIFQYSNNQDKTICLMFHFLLTFTSIESTEHFEYNRSWKQIEGQSNNTTKTKKSYINILCSTGKIQYFYFCGVQKCVIYEKNLKQYVNIRFTFCIFWVYHFLSGAESEISNFHF
jgi:hypothetical protein